MFDLGVGFADSTAARQLSSPLGRLVAMQPKKRRYTRRVKGERGSQQFAKLPRPQGHERSNRSLAAIYS